MLIDGSRPLLGSDLRSCRTACQLVSALLLASLCLVEQHVAELKSEQRLAWAAEVIVEVLASAERLEGEDVALCLAAACSAMHETAEFVLQLDLF